MFTLSERYIRFHVRMVNLFARTFGIMAMLVGVVFCVSAFVETQDRGIFVGAGIVICSIGLAFLLAKPLTVEAVYAMTSALGLRRPDEGASKERGHGA